MLLKDEWIVMIKSVIKKVLRIIPDKTYIQLNFFRRMGRFPNLKNPQTFNEKLQWLKLYDRKPEYTTIVDKYEAKRHVAEHIGEEYVIPTLGVWDKFEDIDFESLPNQFVLKCTHDSGGLVICRDKSKLDLDKVKVKINASLKENYYYQGREWPYKNVKPRIIAEAYITDNNVREESVDKTDEYILVNDLQREYGLLDYKFMCFDGVVRALFLDIGVVGSGDGHAEEYYRNVYDRDGKLLPVRETRNNYPISIQLPENFSKMVEIAETLSQGIPHIRVDLYRFASGEIKVGELTFFHGSGFCNIFDPAEWDRTFGDWLKLPKR